jgi:hypothetical protein
LTKQSRLLQLLNLEQDKTATFTGSDSDEGCRFCYVYFQAASVTGHLRSQVFTHNRCELKVFVLSAGQRAFFQKATVAPRNSFAKTMQEGMETLKWGFHMDHAGSMPVLSIRSMEHGSPFARIHLCDP